MLRFFLQNLLEWKNSPDRKPLLIQGARQVGKTWIMKEFGKTSFKNFIYINFEKNENRRKRNLAYF
ncbi:MAG: AAA family ATPase [Fibromonadaceae bacterium]|jgi:predicted AAA+ superfamily ATPase|nr:AAA family ATPase [Fibromonadaceae bacterium]